MTNHERYKQAFAALHASDDISLEVDDMKKANWKRSMKPVLAVCLGAAILLSCMGVAYAADIGGIRETLQVWFGGKRVDATVVSSAGDGNGGYEFTVDLDGEVKEFGGGGVAIDDNGNERPLTPGEVLEDFSTQMDTDKDGRVWLYHYDQSFDITDYLADGVRKFSLERDGAMAYFDVEYQSGSICSYGMSSEPTGDPADYTQLK